MPRIFWSNVLWNQTKSPMHRIFWWNVLEMKIKSSMPRIFWSNVLGDENMVSYVKNLLMKCSVRWKKSPMPRIWNWSLLCQEYLDEMYWEMKIKSPTPRRFNKNTSLLLQNYVTNIYIWKKNQCKFYAFEWKFNVQICIKYINVHWTPR